MAIFGAPLIPSGVVQALLPGERSGELPQMPAYKKPSTAQMIVGSIGDALQQYGGGHATFGPEMAARRQYAQALQAAQMQRAQQFADQKALYDYKRANPTPDDFTQRYEALNGIKPGLGDTYAQNYAANGGGQPQIVNLPGGGGTYMVPRNGIAAPAGPKVGEIQDGYQFMGGDPASQSSWKPVGGAPSQGGATFP